MSVNPTLASELAQVSSPGTSYTVSQQALLSTIENHIANDIDPFALVANPANSQSVLGARLRLNAMTAPVVTITPVGGAAGSQTYVVVAKINLANLLPSASASTSTGPTTLSATTYNTLTWPVVNGATQYDVYRTSGGATQGLIAANLTFASGVSPSYNDIGTAGDTTSAPTMTALFASATFADLNSIGIATPTLVSSAVIGTAGSTTWTYVVVADSYVGSAAAGSTSVTTGIATMVAGTSYNQISWNYVAGAYQYRIFRTVAGTSPSTTGLIGTVAQIEQATFTFNDNALAGTAYTPPTGNTTGSLATASNLYAAGISLVNGTSAQTAAAGTTLTTANLLCNTMLRSGAAGVSDATPTAAAIVAALGGAGAASGTVGPAVKVGMSWRWTIRNANSGTLTITAGSGVTLAAGNTNTTPTVNAHEFLIVVTNVTAGSEAVTIYSNGPSGAY